MKICLVIAALFFTLHGAVFGADKATGWGRPVGAGTALEAAQRIFSGATLEADGTLVLARDKILRLPGTSKTRAVLPAGTHLGPPEAEVIRSQGTKYLVLLWEGARPDSSEDGGFGDAVAVLAAFPDGSGEPTDVEEVKLDRETYLGKGPDLITDDAFTVINAHHNSSQGYASTDLFHIRDGRLRRIANFFTLSANASCENAFQEDLNWRVEPDGEGPPRIIALLDLVHAPARFLDGCAKAPKPSTEHFQDSYRWNAAQGRYLHESGNSGRLQKWNEKNM